MKRPVATSGPFGRLAAQFAHELLEAIEREAARDHAQRPTLDIDVAQAESLANGFLFPAAGPAEPKSWLAFEENDATPGVFAWRARLDAKDHFPFIVACCRCFLGREATTHEAQEIARRLAGWRLRRIDLVRSLLSADDAHAPGRFLVFAVPSPWADALGAELEFPRLRIET